MSEEAGLINAYVCQTCSGRIVTRNKDRGSTPFMVECHATKGCKGDMVSSFYRVDQHQTPGYEWYRPRTPAERKKIRDEWTQQHVELGGLLLRSLAN